MSRMKSKILLSLLTVVVFVARLGIASDDHGSAASTAEAVPRGEAGFEPDVHDLGEIPWHSTAEFELLFVAGSEPVQISELQSGCGCMIICADGIVGELVPPFQSVAIHGILQILNEVGPMERHVRLVSGNGDRHWARVRLVGVPTYRWTRPMIDFGGVSLFAETPVVHRTRFLSPTSHLLGEIGTPARWLSIGLVAMSSEETEVQVTVYPWLLRSGEQRCRVTFLTSDQFRPIATLAVNIQGLAELRAVPEHALVSPRMATAVEVFDARGAMASVSACGDETPPAGLSFHEGANLSVVSETNSFADALVTLSDQDGRRTRILVSPMPSMAPVH